MPRPRTNIRIRKWFPQSPEMWMCGCNFRLIIIVVDVMEIADANAIPLQFRSCWQSRIHHLCILATRAVHVHGCTPESKVNCSSFVTSSQSTEGNENGYDYDYYAMRRKCFIRSHSLRAAFAPHSIRSIHARQRLRKSRLRAAADFYVT